MKLVEVGIEELEDTSRFFFWKFDQSKRVAPGETNRYYEHYKQLDDGVCPGVQALVWERV